MLQARNVVAHLMDTSTLADVMRGAPVTPGEVQQGLHGEGI